MLRVPPRPTEIFSASPGDSGFHQRLADQECVISGAAQPGDVRAACRSHSRPREITSLESFPPGGERFHIHFEGSQIAIVHSDQIGTRIHRAAQFFFVVGFAEHIQPQRAALLRSAQSIPPAKARHNQQDRIGAVSTCLQQLELVHDEIFLQTRQLGAGGSTLQIRQRSLEKFFIGQHRQSRRSCRFQFLRPGSAGSKLARISPREGEAFFSSAMMAGPVRLLSGQRPPKAARDMLSACRSSSRKSAERFASATRRRVAATIWSSLAAIGNLKIIRERTRMPQRERRLASCSG